MGQACRQVVGTGSMTDTSVQAIDEGQQTSLTDDDYQIQAGLLVMLTAPTHLLGKPIARMLELHAPLTGWHPCHQLPLGQNVSREAKQLERKGNVPVSGSGPLVALL